MAFVVQVPTIDTAVVVVANAVKGGRIGDWQRLHQNGVDQSEDCGIRPYA